MEMTAVTSSHIKAVGHDGSMSMFVEYNTGKTYRFDGVTVIAYADILSAPSVGKAVLACGIKGILV